MADQRRPHTPSRPAKPAARAASGASAPRATPPRTGAARRADAPGGTNAKRTSERAKPRASAPRKRAAPHQPPAPLSFPARASLRAAPGVASTRTAATPTVDPASSGGGPLRRALAKVTGRAPATSGARASAAQPRRGTVATPWAKVTAASATVTTRMEERLGERRSAHRRLLTVRWAKRLLIAGAGVAGVWVLLLSPVFAMDAQEIEASGYGTVVDPSEVASIVSAQDGTSLVLVNVSHIEDQLEALVGVRDATVERVWPSGLRVTLTSAEPVAAIPMPDGTFVMLDEDGVQVAVEDAAPTDLPVVNVPVDADNTRILDGVITVIDETPVALRDRIQDIEATTEDSIHFVLRDGPRVEWGSAEESALKAQVLEVLLEEAADASLIDVSAPTLPTVS